jgi:hypothetical protein
MHIAPSVTASTSTSNNTSVHHLNKTAGVDQANGTKSVNAKISLSNAQSPQSSNAKFRELDLPRFKWTSQPTVQHGKKPVIATAPPAMTRAFVGYPRPGQENWDGRANDLESLDFAQDVPHNVLGPVIEKLGENEDKHLQYVTQNRKATDETGTIVQHNVQLTTSAKNLTERGVDYVGLYKSGNSALYNALKRGGIDIPPQAISPTFLTYAEDEHLNNHVSDKYQTRKLRAKDPVLIGTKYVKPGNPYGVDLAKDCNIDTANGNQVIGNGHKPAGFLTRLRHRQDERKVVKYKSLREFACQKVLGDVKALASAYGVTGNGKDVGFVSLLGHPTLNSMQGMNAFFKKQFGVSPDRNENRQAKREFDTARRITAPATRNVALENALQKHFARLEKKIPLGRSMGSYTERGIVDLAKLYRQEAIDQTRYAAKNIERFTLEDGTYCEKTVGDPAAKAHAFKLVRPFPSEGNETRVELRFTPKDPTNADTHYDMALVTVVKAEDTETEDTETEVDLGANPIDTLKQRFNIDSVIKPLFGDGAQIGQHGFAAIYGKRMAEQVVQDKIVDFINAPYKHVFDVEMADCHAFLGTGYSYNPSDNAVGGHWGENRGNESRGVFMRHAFNRVLKENEMSAAGACGMQQDLIWYAGGRITGVVDLTDDTYLASPHGNDKLTLEEKNTFSEIEPHTATAGNYELSIGKREIGGVRPATSDNPVPQEKQYQLVGEINANDNTWTPATHEKLYEARQLRPLALPVRDFVKFTKTVDGQNVERFVETTGNGDLMEGDSAVDNPLHASWHTLEVRFNDKPVQTLSSFKKVQLADGTELDLMGYMPENLQGEFQAFLGNADISNADKQQIKTELMAGVVAQMLGEIRAGSADAESLDELRFVFTHELPEGSVLVDDIGNPILDHNGEYVTTRETIVVKPTLKEKTVRHATTEPVIDEATGKQKVEMVGTEKVPVFRTVYTEKKINDVKFEIVSVARWRRIGIENPKAPGEYLKDENDNVLSEFKFVEQNFETTADTDPANDVMSKLTDNQFVDVDCVHSQNGLRTPGEQELLKANVRYVGFASKANDVAIGKSFVPVVSAENPMPHAAAVDPKHNKENHISDFAEAYTGGIAAITTNQPHADGLKKEGGQYLDPNGAGIYAKVKEDFHAHREGGENAIGTGVNIKRIKQGTLAELKRATAAALEPASIVPAFEKLKTSFILLAAPKAFNGEGYKGRLNNLINEVAQLKHRSPAIANALEGLKAIRDNAAQDNDGALVPGGDIWKVYQTAVADLKKEVSDVDRRRLIKPTAIAPHTANRNQTLWDRFHSEAGEQKYEEYKATNATGNGPDGGTLGALAVRSDIRSRNVREIAELPKKPPVIKPKMQEQEIPPLSGDEVKAALLHVLNDGDAKKQEAVIGMLLDRGMFGEDLANVDEVKRQTLIGEIKAHFSDPSVKKLIAVMNEVAGSADEFEALSESLDPLRAELETVQNDGKGTNKVLPKVRKLFFRPNNNGTSSIAPGVAAMAGGDTVASAIQGPLDSAGKLTSVAAVGTTAASVGAFAPLLLLLAVESARNGAYAVRRSKQLITHFEAMRNEIAVARNELTACKDDLEAASAGKLGKRLTQNGLKRVDERMSIARTRTEVMRKQLKDQIFLTASTSTALGADGVLVGIEAVSSAFPAAHGLGVIAGAAGSAVLAAYGLARLVHVGYRYKETNAVKKEFERLRVAGELGTRFCAESGLGLTVLEHLAHETRGQKFQGLNLTMFTLSNGLIAFSPLMGPAAPAVIGVGAVGVAVSTALAFIQPDRQWRGRDARNGGDTTHIFGSYLSTLRRQNRLVHHLRGKVGVTQGEIEKIVETLGGIENKYTTPRRTQFRYKFEQLRGLRWLAPNFDRKILADEIVDKFNETKGHQCNFMLRTTDHEVNHWKFVVGELTAEAADLELAVAGTNAEMKDRLGTDSAMRQRLAAVRDELDKAQTRYTTLVDLHTRVRDFQKHQGSAWSDKVKSNFRDLQVRYLIAHDLLVDSMSRKKFEELHAAVGGHSIQVRRDDKFKFANVKVNYEDASIQTIRANMGTDYAINKAFVKAMCFATFDNSSYEIMAVVNQYKETMGREIKEKKAAARAAALVPTAATVAV